MDCSLRTSEAPSPLCPWASVSLSSPPPTHTPSLSSSCTMGFFTSFCHHLDAWESLRMQQCLVHSVTVDNWPSMWFEPPRGKFLRGSHETHGCSKTHTHHPYVIGMGDVGQIAPLGFTASLVLCFSAWSKMNAAHQPGWEDARAFDAGKGNASPHSRRCSASVLDKTEEHSQACVGQLGVPFLWGSVDSPKLECHLSKVDHFTIDIAVCPGIL